MPFSSAVIIIGSILILSSQKTEYLLPFYAISGNIFMGAFVLCKNCKNKTNISFAVTTFIISFWAALLFLYGNSKGPSEAIFWAKTAWAITAFMPVSFLCFFSFFPREENPPKTYQMLAWFLLAAFFSIISFTELIVKNVLLINNKLIFVPGPAFILLILYFSGFIIFAFYRLFEKYHHYRNAKKQQSALIILGFFPVIIVVMATNLLLPLFGRSDLVGIGPFSTVITIAVISYAITKYHLMDINIIVNRFMSYLVLLIIYSLLGFFALYFFSFFVPLGLNLHSLLFLILLLLTAGLIFHPLRLHLQTTPDRFLFRKKYEYERAIKELGEKCGTVVETKTLATLFSKKIKGLIKTDNLKIYFVE